MRGRVVVMLSSSLSVMGCASWRLPPVATQHVEVASARTGPTDAVRRIEAVEPPGEPVPDVLVARTAGASESEFAMVDGRPVPRRVRRGGEEIWIGEPDRVRQSWIDELPFPPLCPIVLAFDAAPVELRPTPAAAPFDFGGDASCTNADWPSAATPWLVLDRDGSGAIEDGGELFGTGTRLPSGAFAAQGFEALAVLDANGDGRLDARDPAWASLRLWSDHDGDRRSTSDELTALSAHGITSLSLDLRAAPRCDDRGNCEVERAAFDWHTPDGAAQRGAIVDVHLSCPAR